MKNFFIICPIGLEKELIRELQFKWEIHFNDAKYNFNIHKGGIELECPQEIGLLLNKILKTPSKILLRLKSQKCRDIPKLYNIFKKFPWKDYLNQEDITLSISAKKSRLIHTDKIKKAALDGIKDYFNANQLKQSLIDKHRDDPKQSLHIRLFNDELAISLDTSGDLLHIRGESSFRGHASIRENIASLLLWKLIPKEKDETINLIDPMCGTATFLKEAKDQFKLNTRTHAFEYLSTNITKDIPQLTESANKWDIKFTGLDIDPAIIEKVSPIEGIKLQTGDIFETLPKSGLENTFIICNPPYGKRVKIKEDKYEYFKKLIDQIIRVYTPIRLGVIIPVPFEKGIKGEKLYFKQNGIDVCFVTQNCLNS